jgi:UDP-N-acetylglucosamine 3-dehydrogenase
MIIFKRYKIGIIGCGYWATNLIKTLEDNGYRDIEVFDKSTDKLRIIKNKFPFLKISKSFDLLVKKKLECIFLITPSSTHYELANKILKFGHNLFLEKPGTLKLNHIKKLTEISKRKNLTLMVGYIYNYNVYINYIKKILIKKKLGRIKYMYFERSNLGPIRNDTSCLWDLAAHDISTSYYLLGKKPIIQNISGNKLLNKSFFDISYLKLKYARINVEIKSSWLNPEKIRKMVIIGEKKMLQFDEMAKENKIKIYNKYATYPKISKFKNFFFTPHANIYLGSTTSPKIKFRSPLSSELTHFFHCIKNKKKPLTDGNYAQEITRILEGASK